MSLGQLGMSQGSCLVRDLNAARVDPEAVAQVSPPYATNAKAPKVAFFFFNKNGINPFLVGSHIALLLQPALHSTLKIARFPSKYPNNPPLNTLTAAPCLSSCSGRCFLNMLAVMVQRQGKISLFWFSCYPIPAAIFPLKSV